MLTEADKIKIQLLRIESLIADKNACTALLSRDIVECEQEQCDYQSEFRRIDLEISEHFSILETESSEE